MIKENTCAGKILAYMKNHPKELKVSEFVKPSDHFVGYSAGKFMSLLKKYGLVEITNKNKRSCYAYKITEFGLKYEFGTWIDIEQLEFKNIDKLCEEIHKTPGEKLKNKLDKFLNLIKIW